MPKDSLKDRVDGGVLDLSLLELTSIPVKELVDIPKAVHLDLSCNLLVTLPNDISRLSHIVHLDLSKNNITSLPDSIGGLHKLQHLDLYRNSLTSLPVGFCHLKNLKWLDIKDNPLQEPHKSVAGDCLDDKQCRNCAQKVVAFMKKVDSEQERIKQRKLAFEREEEAKKKAEEDKEIDRVRQLKKAQREARKLEKAKTQKEIAKQSLNDHAKKFDGKNVPNGSTSEIKLKESKRCFGWCGLLMSVFIVFIAVNVGVYLFCQNNPSESHCMKYNEYYNILEEKAIDHFNKACNYSLQVYIDVKTYCSPHIEQFKRKSIDLLNNIWIVLEPKLIQVLVYLRYVYGEVVRITDPYMTVILHYAVLIFQQLQIYFDKFYYILEENFTLLHKQIIEYFDKK